MDKFLGKLEKFLDAKITRRNFIKTCLLWLVYLAANVPFVRFAFARTETSDGREKKGIKGDYDIVLAEGKDPYKNTVAAVEKMGGMKRFVKAGDVVVVKPNMAWDRTPLQAANTDPMVVAALVDLAYKAGAKRVRVFDRPCNDERACHLRSGIEEAAKKKGAQVLYVNEWNVAKAHFPYQSPMENWPMLRDAIDCDVFINVPVLKHHSLTGLTLSMKNLMGVCSGTRGLIHMDIGRKLVDITNFINPDLTVVDATRVLVRNGPSGGDLADVVEMDKVFVATDPTLADTFACTLVKKDPMTVPNIRNACQRKIGSTDIGKARVLKVGT